MEKQERKLEKIRYSLKIECYLDDESGDYAGENATLADFMEIAERDIQSIQVLIKRGGTEPKPVRARITVGAIVLTPKNG